MSDELNQPKNPCDFKAQCKRCKVVAMEDRPGNCKSLQCPEFTPCKTCGCNRTLDETGLCSGCGGSSNNRLKHKKQALKEGEIGIGASGGRVVKIGVPGVPPDLLTAAEVEYYNRRWADYAGYYRDPAAYHACHIMILEELNLSEITNRLLGSRGDKQDYLLKLKDASVRILKSLKEQLPEKEAAEISDDEKSLSGLYESYIKEKELRTIGKVSRILTAEAVALAPELPFKLDIKKLLVACGFTVSTIEEAIGKYITEGDLPKTPDAVLEFFGFELKEKYALPFRGDSIANENDTTAGMDELHDVIDLEPAETTGIEPTEEGFN